MARGKSGALPDKCTQNPQSFWCLFCIHLSLCTMQQRCSMVGARSGAVGQPVAGPQTFGGRGEHRRQAGAHPIDFSRKAASREKGIGEHPAELSSAAVPARQDGRRWQSATAASIVDIKPAPGTCRRLACRPKGAGVESIDVCTGPARLGRRRRRASPRRFHSSWAAAKPPTASRHAGWRNRARRDGARRAAPDRCRVKTLRPDSMEVLK